MKNLLFVIALLIILITTRGYGMSGCSVKAPLCGAVTGISSTLGGAVANACSCDPVAVTSSFFSVLNVSGVCTVGGPISSTLCPIAIDAISGFVASRLNQSAWKCTGFSNPACGGGLTAMLQTACLAIPAASLK